jgi:hypothetical protein
MPEGPEGPEQTVSLAANLRHFDLTTVDFGTSTVSKPHVPKAQLVFYRYI